MAIFEEDQECRECGKLLFCMECGTLAVETVGEE